MRVLLIGVGGAGGRLAAAIRAAERALDAIVTDGHVIVVDTDREALDALEQLPAGRRVLIGDTIDGIDGGGTAGDPEIAAEAARTDDYEIQRSFDDVPIEDLDAVVVAAGIAGGTGGGAGAVVVEQCTELFDLPVYAVTALPQESADDHAALTAARSLVSFVRLADNVFPIDNETWIAEDNAYAAANRAIAERLVYVFSLGTFDGMPAEARVDRTDIIRTLSTGGVSAIGFADTQLELGWRRWFRWLPWVSVPPGENDARRLKLLVRQAVESKLTIPCAVASTERALVVTAGPPEVLSRKGFESARYWLEDELETVEIIAGDEPRPRADAVTALIVLSNVTDVPRIEELKERGLTALACDRSAQ